MIILEQAFGKARGWVGGIAWLSQARAAVEQLAARRRPLRLLLAILAAVTRNDAQQLTAGVAYYAMVALIPISVAILQIFSLALGQERARAWFAAIAAGILPSNIDLTTLLAPRDATAVGIAGLLAFLGLLWGSVKLFGAVGVVVNRMWGIEPIQVSVIGKTRQFLFLSATALVLLASSLLTYAMTQGLAPDAMRALQYPELADAIEPQRWWSNLLAWLLSVAAYLMVYRYVPERVVRWRWAILGALFAGVAFKLVNYIFALFLTYVAPSHLLYGPLASVLIVLIWLFMSALTLVSGAAVAAYGQSVYEGDGPTPGPGWFLK